MKKYVLGATLFALLGGVMPTGYCANEASLPGEGGGENETAASYRAAAECGDAGAQFNLGVCYAKGEGVEKDAAQAAEWIRKAAEQGHAEAQYNLAMFYANGIGVEKDAAQAAFWFRKAADQGLQEAIQALRDLASDE